MPSSPIWDAVTSTTDALIPKDVKPHLRDVLQWRPGHSPLSTHTSVVAACLVYFALIFGGQAVMANSRPLCARFSFTNMLGPRLLCFSQSSPTSFRAA